MNCLLVLSLAVLGASASPCGVGFNTVSTGCGAAVPGITTVAQTPVIESPASFVPSYIPPTSVSQSCHCMKTIVRPQIRNEVITVPQVDRLVRYVPSPVVDVVSVNAGGNTRNVDIPTCGVNSQLPALVDGVSGISGVVVGSSFPSVVGTGFGRIAGSGIVGTGFGGVVGSGIVGTGFGGVVGSGIVGTGFGGVVSSGIVGNSCGSNIIV